MEILAISSNDEHIDNFFFTDGTVEGLPVDKSDLFDAAEELHSVGWKTENGETEDVETAKDELHDWITELRLEVDPLSLGYQFDDTKRGYMRVRFVISDDGNISAVIQVPHGNSWVDDDRISVEEFKKLA